MLLAMLVLLADGMVSVPPSRWQAIEVRIPQHGTLVDCAFRVVEGSRVSAILLDLEQAERFHRGRSMRPLYSTGFENSARFRYRVSEAGDYVLLLDNRIEGRGPTLVDLRLELLHTQSVHVRELPLERRRAVVAASLLFFGAVAVLSARQYLKQQS